MFILIVTLIAHIAFTVSDAYWLFLWLDMPVHFFMGAGLAIIFARNFSWGTNLSVIAVFLVAVGWEYAERLLGFAQAIAETYKDAASDIVVSAAGGIIGTLYARKD